MTTTEYRFFNWEVSVSMDRRPFGPVGTVVVGALFVLVYMPIGIVLDPILKALGRRGCFDYSDPTGIDFNLTAESFRRPE